MNAKIYLNVVTTLMLLTIWFVLGIVGVMLFEDHVAGHPSIDDDGPKNPLEDKVIVDSFWNKAMFDTAGDNPTVLRAPCPAKYMTKEAFENGDICHYLLVFNMTDATFPGEEE